MCNSTPLVGPNRPVNFSDPHTSYALFCMPSAYTTICGSAPSHMYPKFCMCKNGFYDQEDELGWFYLENKIFHKVLHSIVIAMVFIVVIRILTNSTTSICQCGNLVE